MNRNKGTYYKALLLLIVFSMNTVVSFACSFSTLFHQSHHHNSAISEEHHHSDKGTHEHEHAGQHHDTPKPEKKDVKDCCSESVVSIEKVEKSVSRTIEAPNVIFLTSFLAVYSDLLNIYTALPKVVLTYYDRWRVPTTIQDLRIVIQSFQI